MIPGHHKGQVECFLLVEEASLRPRTQCANGQGFFVAFSSGPLLNPLTQSQFRRGPTVLLRLLLVVGLACVIGCGGPTTYPIEGVVTFDGKPVPTGWVSFLSEANERNTAEIGGDGRYLIDLPAGEHRVGISAPREQTTVAEGINQFTQKIPPPYVPHNYADPKQTGIVVSVQEGGENKFDLKLKRDRRRRSRR